MIKSYIEKRGEWLFEVYITDCNVKLELCIGYEPLSESIQYDYDGTELDLIIKEAHSKLEESKYNYVAIDLCGSGYYIKLSDNGLNWVGFYYDKSGDWIKRMNPKREYFEVYRNVRQHLNIIDQRRLE